MPKALRPSIMVISTLSCAVAATKWATTAKRNILRRKVIVFVDINK